MKLDINYITESGCCIYGSVSLSRDWTMCELANKLREMGVVYFRIGKMKEFVKLV